MNWLEVYSAVTSTVSVVMTVVQYVRSLWVSRNQDHR